MMPTAARTPCGPSTSRCSRPDRLVWIEPDVEGGMRTTITFVDLHDGRTEVVTHQTNVPAAYLSAEARAGFNTSLDRFDVYVAGLSTSTE